MTQHEATTTGLEHCIRDLARLRVEMDAAKQGVKDAEAALQATPEHRALEECQARAKALDEALYATTRAVREYTLEAFRATGDKNPHKAVSIRLYKQVKYEREAMQEWLYIHAPAYLVPDDGAIKKVADTLHGAPLEITLDPRPTIAGDLSKYLPEQTQAPEPVAESEAVQ
jgi:hypothetical protein